MRDHASIVREHGALALGRALRSAGFDLSASAPQRWADRDSIPGEYWATLARLEVASLDELAAAAEARKVTQLEVAACSRCGERAEHPHVASCTSVHCPMRQQEAA